MPVEWQDGNQLRWDEGGNLLWENEPIPGPVVVFPTPQPVIRRPGRFVRRVREAAPAALLPLLTGLAPPTTATYRIEVRNRETGQINPTCRFVEGLIEAEFGAVLDDISSAFVTITAPENNDGVAGAQLTEWVDELVFYRDRNPEPVWVGPIVGSTESMSELTIRAVDRLGNIGDRRAPINHPAFAREDPTVDPHDLALWILTAAEQQAPLGLTLIDPPYATSAPLVTAEIVAGDLLFDALTNLAEDSIDFTVVGPRLYFGAPTITVPDLPQLDTRIHWLEDGAAIDSSAMNMATEIEVVGVGGAVAYWPPVPASSFLFRPLRLVRENITSVAQLERIARDAWASAQAPSVTVLTDPSLSPDAPVAVEDLIPGRMLTIHHLRGERELYARQRLVAVTTSVQTVVGERGGWALAETSVQVELEPALRVVEGDS